VNPGYREMQKFVTLSAYIIRVRYSDLSVQYSAPPQTKFEKISHLITDQRALFGYGLQLSAKVILHRDCGDVMLGDPLHHGR